MNGKDGVFLSLSKDVENKRKHLSVLALQTAALGGKRCIWQHLLSGFFVEFVYGSKTQETMDARKEMSRSHTFVSLFNTLTVLYVD